MLSHSTHPTRTGKSFLLSALRLALVGLTALYLFAQYVRRTSMFFPARFPEGPWQDLAGEDVTFTSDGVRLHGRLFRANGPLIVYCHGNAGNLSDRGFIAAELARRGVAVLLFDWRGYGKSEGVPTESALFKDALAAYDYAMQVDPRPAQRGEGGRRPGEGPNIVMYGESLGGPYAAYVAAHRKVSRVIIENSFPSLCRMGNVLYHPLPLGMFAPLALRTQQWLNNAGVPVLVLHGKRDAVIPFSLGKELYDGLRVPKQMLVSETGGHCEMANTDTAQFYDTIVRFVTGT